MKQIRMLAQYYVDLMMKLGLVRFSMLLALALVVLAIVVQMAVTMVLHGQVESIDVIRSIFFGLLITPWAVYFLSVVVEQLEESRQRLSRLVDKLEAEYLLSFERCPFHTETPDHYALVSYLIDLLVSQSSALMPLHSKAGYQSAGGHL